MIFLFVLFMTVVSYLAAVRVKKTTTNTGLIGMTALVLSPAVFGYAVVRYFQSKKEGSGQATPAVAAMLVAYAVIAVAGIGFVAHDSQAEAVKGTIDSLLEAELTKKGVTAKFVSIPQLAGVPFIGPSAYDGYFSADGLTGKQCEFATFAFRVQTVSDDGSWVLNIPGDDFSLIKACTN